MLQVQREGTDVTLVGYGKMVGYNLEAAEQLEKEGISCEVSRHLTQEERSVCIKDMIHMTSLHWRGTSAACYLQLMRHSPSVLIVQRGQCRARFLHHLEHLCCYSSF